ncbi:aminotransferase class I/II-fold pyridoxal phosphate-dependent enzyme [Labrys sp. KNU-23]|uniref:trans-sulfuration enzyme family protein n=1 Tax=Labrys sp. KNU-23 TaxID=2789216 RepID=UPI0011EF8B81|nr:aminotransferase class I/II-fold pyridoxal phosphate-dependent enzyme [Labrys sp. KNU-23]QEN86384.1 aminotransferase class I/II-fold pyridoxal phosphate-dependent enzyme [Labrys sp. KNU-23]
MSSKELDFASRAVFYAPEPESQSISYPIYMSANFQYAGDIYDQIVAGARKEVNIYSRCGNPTEYKLEEHLAQLTGADACLATASGMAAISHALFGILKAGDHIVTDLTTYSSTHEFFDHRIGDFGITVSFVDTTDPVQVERAFTDKTKVLYFEALANPTMKVPPMRKLVEIAHSRGIVVICDNTFASPAVCQPHAFGVDVVVESATKFIGGHNDAVGGVITLKSELLPKDWLEDVRWNTLNKLGAPLSPFNAWLLLRGAQTLALRLEKQCANAAALARFLEGHDKVKRVFYPGLPSHPNHASAKEQLRNFGAMLSFQVESEEHGVRLLKRLKLCSFAASLGGLRTTTQMPGTMAFLDIPSQERQAMGIVDGLVRFSVGIEHADDIIADVAQAIDQMHVEV